MRLVVLCLKIPPEIEMRAMQHCLAAGVPNHEEVLAAAAVRGLPAGLAQLEKEHPSPRKRRRRAG